MRFKYRARRKRQPGRGESALVVNGRAGPCQAGPGLRSFSRLFGRRAGGERDERPKGIIRLLMFTFARMFSLKKMSQNARHRAVLVVTVGIALGISTGFSWCLPHIIFLSRACLASVFIDNALAVVHRCDRSAFHHLKARLRLLEALRARQKHENPALNSQIHLCAGAGSPLRSMSRVEILNTKDELGFNQWCTCL